VNFRGRKNEKAGGASAAPPFRTKREGLKEGEVETDIKKEKTRLRIVGRKWGGKVYLNAMG